MTQNENISNTDYELYTHFNHGGNQEGIIHMGGLGYHHDLQERWQKTINYKFNIFHINGPTIDSDGHCLYVHTPYNYPKSARDLYPNAVRIESYNGNSGILYRVFESDEDLLWNILKN